MPPGGQLFCPPLALRNVRLQPRYFRRQPCNFRGGEHAFRVFSGVSGVSAPSLAQICNCNFRGGEHAFRVFSGVSGVSGPSLAQICMAAGGNNEAPQRQSGHFRVARCALGGSSQDLAPGRGGSMDFRDRPWPIRGDFTLWDVGGHRGGQGSSNGAVRVLCEVALTRRPGPPATT